MSTNGTTVDLGRFNLESGELSPNNHINCLSLTDERVIRSCRFPELE